MLEQFIIDAAWAVCSTHHNILGSSKEAAVFGQDILFDLSYLADWKAKEPKQQLVNDEDAKENEKCIDHDNAISDKALIINYMLTAKLGTSTLGSSLLYKYIKSYNNDTE